jgi:hypothetical protein
MPSFDKIDVPYIFTACMSEVAEHTLNAQLSTVYEVAK